MRESSRIVGRDPGRARADDQAGRPDGRSRRLRRAPGPGARGQARLQGLPRLSRRRSASRSTRRSSTASPRPGRSGRGHRQPRFRRSLRRLLRRRRPDLSGRRGSEPGPPADPDAAERVASTTGLDQLVEGNRISDISHAVQTARRGRRAFPSSARSSATASARSSTRSPQVPNFGFPGRGPRIRRGLVLAIEPMIAAGRLGGRDPGATAGRP